MCTMPPAAPHSVWKRVGVTGNRNGGTHCGHSGFGQDSDNKITPLCVYCHQLIFWPICSSCCPRQPSIQQGSSRGMTNMIQVLPTASMERQILLQPDCSGNDSGGGARMPQHQRLLLSALLGKLQGHVSCIIDRRRSRRWCWSGRSNLRLGHIWRARQERPSVQHLPALCSF